MNEKSIYLFFGEEKYLIEKEVHKIKKQFGTLVNGINFVILDETNVESLVADIQTPAFGYSKKLIIVKNSGLFKKSKKKKSDLEVDNNESLTYKIAEYIDDNIDVINDSIVLIFIEETIEKNELYKSIEKNGIVLEYKKLKSIEAEKNISNICRAYNVHIDNQTVRYFIETCGTDMR